MPVSFKILFKVSKSHLSFPDSAHYILQKWMYKFLSIRLKKSKCHYEGQSESNMTHVTAPFRKSVAEQ